MVSGLTFMFVIALFVILALILFVVAGFILKVSYESLEWVGRTIWRRLKP